MRNLWRLRHWLFGTHFVVAVFAHDEHIRAVRFAPNGRPFVIICSTFIWLLDERDWDALTFDKDEWLSRHRNKAGEARAA